MKQVELLDSGYIGKRIQSLIEEKDTNVKEVSKKANLRFDFLARIIRTSPGINLYTLARICDGFGISLDEFFHDKKGE